MAVGPRELGINPFLIMAFWEKWRKVRLFLEYILTTRVPEEAKKQVEYKYIYYNNISSLKIDFTSNQLKFFSTCMQEFFFFLVRLNFVLFHTMKEQISQWNCKKPLLCCFAPCVENPIKIFTEK